MNTPLQSYLFSTDWHVTDNWPESRKDNYLNTIMGKVEFVVSLANKLDAHLLLGGDLVDKYNSKPKIINLLISQLIKAKQEVFGIIGNHDIFGHNHEVIKRVILGALFESKVVTLLDARPRIITKNGVSVQLTGTNYTPDIDVKGVSSYSIVKAPEANFAIHLVHGLLVERHLPVMKSRNYTLLTEVITRADVLCCGHEHTGFGVRLFENVIFTNPGALGRINASLKELRRMPFVSYIKVYSDHVEVDLIAVPAATGPEVLSRQKIIETLKRKKMLTEFKDNLSLTDIGRGSLTLKDILEEKARLGNVGEDVVNVSLRAIKEYEEEQHSC